MNRQRKYKIFVGLSRPSGTIFLPDKKKKKPNCHTLNYGLFSRRPEACDIATRKVFLPAGQFDTIGDADGDS